jgi:Protein of unknown function (DUF2637)
MLTPQRFSDLTTFGKALILLVGALTLGVAAAAFAASYGALYAWVETTGLYADSGRYAGLLNAAWPLLFDAAFIVAQLAAILAGLLRGSRVLPFLVMVVTAAGTVWFNLQHAGADPGRRLAAVIPPVLMVLTFELDLQIVKWVLAALGKPLEAPGPYSPTGPPAALWRADSGPYGYVPGAGYGVFPPHPLYGHLPSATQQRTGQNGHDELPEETKRQHVEAYLAGLTPTQLAAATRSQVAAELIARGVLVDETYAGRILGEWRTPARGRRRGRG